MAHCVLQEGNHFEHEQIFIVNVVLRYSISESLGYLTEIADDAQLFLR